MERWCPAPQPALELFSKHLWAFRAFSVTNKMLFKHLISTKSVNSKSIYGMLCGRKNELRKKNCEIFSCGVLVFIATV